MKRRAPQDGTMYERKDGRWEAVLHLGYANGKRVRKSFYGKTQHEVREKLAAAQRNLHQGIAPVGDRQTIGQFLDGWLEDAARQRVRPTTFQSYESLIRNHLKPGLGRVALS
jgi:hypothetical protein